MHHDDEPGVRQLQASAAARLTGTLPNFLLATGTPAAGTSVLPLSIPGGNRALP